MARGPAPGERAPGFEAIDQHERVHRLEDYRGAWLVLFFYPADDTPGCTEQACRFRDRISELESAGVRVIGVSRGSARRHRAFADKHHLPFPLLADRDARILRAYGAIGFLGLPKRVTFLIDPEGVVRHVHASHLRPARHVDVILDALSRLKKEGAAAAARPE